jgi:predicted nuclease of predicted toxin-antitoxin system
MKFKIDENMPIEAAEDLRAAGHDTATLIDQQLTGESDERIAAVCKAEGRAVETLDLDFADIRAYPPANYPGIVVLRPALQTVPSIRSLVRLVISILPAEPLSGRLWIVSETQVRMRPGDSGS